MVCWVFNPIYGVMDMNEKLECLKMAINVLEPYGTEVDQDKVIELAKSYWDFVSSYDSLEKSNPIVRGVASGDPTILEIHKR